MPHVSNVFRERPTQNARREIDASVFKVIMELYCESDDATQMAQLRLVKA